MFSQDEVLQNSSMLRNSTPFVPTDTRNWSAFLARSGQAFDPSGDLLVLQAKGRNRYARPLPLNMPIPS